MGAEIVHDHDVAGLQGRDENLFDIEQKTLGIDRAVEAPGRFDPIPPQSGDEGHGVPVAERHLSGQALARTGSVFFVCEPCATHEIQTLWLSTFRPRSANSAKSPVRVEARSRSRAKKPDLMRAVDLPRLVATHLAGLKLPVS